MKREFVVEAISVQSCAIELLDCETDGNLSPRVNVR